jgi:hypothetical protein
MRTAYEEADGFEAFSGVDYDSLSCKDCHAPGDTERNCDSCHLDNLHREDATCHKCHGRQAKLNVVLNVKDAHQDAGMGCVDCHGHKDVHGTGVAYITQLEEGAISAQCENCHQDLSPTKAHTIHGDRLHCSACHTGSTVSCYNCHFDTFVATNVKKAYGALSNWVFLMNDRKGQITAANFQSLSYDAGATGNGDKFVVWAPFESHSVTRIGRPCVACHGVGPDAGTPALNKALHDLVYNDRIRITDWDGGAGKLTQMTGVIPIVDGKMELQFLTYNGTAWSPIGGPTLPDKTQYYFGSPLTAWQIAKMKQDQTDTE